MATPAEALLAARLDGVGLAVRQRLFRQQVEQALAGGLDDGEAAASWRALAGEFRRLGGDARAAARLDAVADLCDGLQL